MYDIKALQKGVGEPSHHDGNAPSPPQWLDLASFNRGRKFYQDYFFCHFMAMFTSLVCGLSVRNLLEPLLFTQASDEPVKAFKRYFKTFQHISLWHIGDLWDTHSQAHRSMETVRNIHRRVAGDMNNNGTMTESRLYFSQYDMALVQCGFMGSSVLYPKLLGMPGDKQTLEDYIHFWRGVGYMLGISDKYNICADGYDAAYAKCKAIEVQVLLPSLRDPPKEFQKMADAFIAGTNNIFKFKLFSTKSVLAFSLDGMGHTIETLSVGDHVRLYFLKGLLFLVKRSSFIRNAVGYCLKKVIQVR